MSILNLNGYRILITGATGYLGKVIAEGLAVEGATIIVNSRDKDKASTLVNDLRSRNFKAEEAVFDISDNVSIETFFGNYKEPINCIINNAYNGKSGSILNCESQSYVDSYNVSVVSAHNIIRNAFKNLELAVKMCGDASIINIASMYGIVSPDLRIYENLKVANPPFYGSAKAALIHFSKYAACEFAPFKIRCNSISPGPFPNKLVQESNPEFISKLENKVPLGRIGDPKELIGPIAFLASKASSYVTGVNIPVDGGWTAW